jgi:hypothetical protein
MDGGPRAACEDESDRSRSKGGALNRYPLPATRYPPLTLLPGLA